MRRMKAHHYQAHLIWDGNLGDGTSTYAGYGRQHRVVIAGKPDLVGSSDPMFRGEKEKHNPEDLFVAAIVSCHMLAYLALCARNGVCVTTYEDAATGTLVFDGSGGGKFEEVTLHPVVTIAEGDADLAMKLHEKAHAQCFIASSCSVPIHHQAKVLVAERV